MPKRAARPRSSRRPARRPPRPVAAAAKISVTVDTNVLEDVKAVVRRTGQSLSAHITEALARDVRRRRLAELVAEYEAAAGVISEAELAQVRSAWRD